MAVLWARLDPPGQGSGDGKKVPDSGYSLKVEPTGCLEQWHVQGETGIKDKSKALELST